MTVGELIEHLKSFKSDTEIYEFDHEMDVWYPLTGLAMNKDFGRNLYNRKCRQRKSKEHLNRKIHFIALEFG